MLLPFCYCLGHFSVGYLILFGIMLVAYVSYYYEQLILRSKYVTDPHDYAIFLKGGQETLIQQNLNDSISAEDKVTSRNNSKLTLACGSVVSLLRFKKEVSLLVKHYYLYVCTCTFLFTVVHLI